MSLQLNASTKSAEWFYSETQLSSHLLPLVWQKVSAKFSAVFFPVSFERKFPAIFAAERRVIQEQCWKNLTENLQKDVRDFLKPIFEGKRTPEHWIQMQEEFSRAVSERYRDTYPLWLIDTFEKTRKARELFSAALSGQRVQVISFLKKFAEGWFKNYYEDQTACWEESQQEVNPDFFRLMEESKKAIQDSLKVFFVDECVIRDALRNLFEQALTKRPFDHLVWLVEHMYFDLRPRSNDKEVIDACITSFYRRFPGVASIQVNTEIATQYRKIKNERKGQLEELLRTSIENYLTREETSELLSSRKPLVEKIAEEVDERFHDEPLSKDQCQDFVFFTYSLVKAREWNLKCQARFDKKARYPFVFPDKKESFHQRLYSEFLDSLFRDMARDFAVSEPFSEKMRCRIIKMAHDALNECIRNVAHTMHF